MIQMYHPIGRMGFTDARADFILALAAGKTVLHLGCVDAGLTDERIQKGDLLHARLQSVAKRLVGVDVDSRGIERLAALGFANVVAADIQQDVDLGEQFEVVVAGEILEHLDAPGGFLSRIGRFLLPNGVLVVSVPNAYSLLHGIRMFRGVEVVHEDHVAYYSVRTLRTLLARHGFAIVDAVGYSETHRLGRGGAFVKRLLNWAVFRRMPQVSEGLVVVATHRSRDRA